MTSKSSWTAAIEPSGRGTPPWLVPVWTLTLLIPTAPGATPVQLAFVAVEVRPQLLLGRVLLADLADLAADADGQPVWLELADQRRQLGCALVVLALLEVDGRLGQVDQGRAVDVDVAVADLERLAAGRPDLLGHLLGVGGVFAALNW